MAPALDGEHPQGRLPTISGNERRPTLA